MPQISPQQSKSLLHGWTCWQQTPALHVPAHAPQVPPQPSGPQFLPKQLGVQQSPPVQT
jgi:hypothetical protein